MEVMPTRCNKSGCRYGNQKLYKGKGARAKANRQGRAIRASQARQRKR